MSHAPVLPMEWLFLDGFPCATILIICAFMFLFAIVTSKPDKPKDKEEANDERKEESDVLQSREK